MSILSAMQNGISGLLANASAVGGISSNIANANTDGFRRSFSHMVTTATKGVSQDGAVAGVRAERGTDMASSGAIRRTTDPTNLAVGGEGFFVVTRTPNSTNQADYLLTRVGSFQADENGFLKNQAGYYLAGYGYDEAGNLGTVDRSGFGNLMSVDVSDFTVSGNATTNMGITGNIPSQVTGQATPGDPFVTTSEYFSPLGEPGVIQLEWQPSANRNEWDLSFADQDGNTYGSVTLNFNDSGPNAGTPLGYSGVTSTATAPAGFAFDTATGAATVTIDNGTTPQTIDIQIGAPNTFDGVTQFSGDFSPLDITRDGTATGTLVRTEVSNSGDVMAVLDNGDIVPIFSIPLAIVTNPAGLALDDGAAYSVTSTTGTIFLGEAGTGSAGSILGGAVEGSNVEIAQELTNLIQTQRAYSSNAQIVTTADEMLEETVRIKR